MTAHARRALPHNVGLPHRMKCARGEDLTQSKLTEEVVREVRAQQAAKQEIIRVLNEKFSSAALAKKHGVHKNTMDKVLNYATWVHVK